MSVRWLDILAVCLAALAICSAGPDRASAQSYDMPARGTELRADILDALRPIAEWRLGAPVEFIVGDLRVAGDVAFAMVTVQRPGGAAIDIGATPMVERDGISPVEIDGPRLDALLRKSGRMWVPVLHGIGATDVWYAQDALCGVWGTVLPEYCGG